MARLYDLSKRKWKCRLDPMAIQKNIDDQTQFELTLYIQSE